MTVSAHTSTATGSGQEDIDGGVIANGGNIAGSRFTAKKPSELVSERSDLYGSKVIANTGSAYEAGIALARSGGTLAYNPSSPTSSDNGVIGVGFNSLLNGIAGTTDIIRGLRGGDQNRRGGNIHPKAKYYQRGTWATAIFNIFKNPTAASTNNHGLLQSDGTAKAGITNYGSSVTLAVDDAVTNWTKSGEFVILQGFVDFTSSSTSGDGTASENLMDYSDITG